MKKIKKKKVIIIACVAAAAVGCSAIAANGLLSSKVSVEASVGAASETKVTKGDISNTVSGTGTLTLDGDTSIKIPSGITIEDTKVTSGQEVKAGDILATVNMRSVYSAIETIESRISALDSQIASVQSNTNTTNVSAGVKGTVTKIYASVGDDAYSCISKNGALMEITTSDGNIIKVISSGGTIKSIPVSEGSSVTADTTVLTILAGSLDASYKGYIAEREDLVEQLDELLKIESSGAITAPQDGIIADVNISSSSSSSSGTSSSSTGTGTTTSLSGSTTNTYSASYTGNLSSSAVLTSCTKTVLLSETVTDDDTSQDTSSDASANDTKLSFSIVSSESSTKENLGILSPAKDQKVMNEIFASDNSYTGTISWTPQMDSFAANTIYQANVKLTAGDGYCFAADSILSLENGIISGLQISDNGKTLSFTISYPSYSDDSDNNDKDKDNSDNNTDDDKTQNNSSDNNKNTDKTTNTNSSEDFVSGGTDSSTYSIGNISSGNVDLSSYTSSDTVASADTAVSAASSDNSSSASTSSMVTAFTLSTQGNLSVSVSVDELDINSMSIGQEATVTLDAIENQSFTGTVSSIANTSSSSSGGVAKYTVKLTLPKDDSMKIGMNASVNIVASESTDVLIIPVSALQERGDESYVYTKIDEDGNLSGEVTVTTGLSDGTNVEIKDGLEEGTTIYYQKSDSSNSSDGIYSDMDNFDMGDVQFDDGNTGGGGPQGGGAPSGDAPGGGQ